MTSETMLARQVENAEKLKEVLQIAAQEQSLKETLDECLRIVLSTSWLSILKKGGIFLTDETGKALRLVSHCKLNPELLTLCARVPFGHCLCGRAAGEKAFQFASCVDHRHDTAFDGMEPHGHYNVPIIYQGDVLGVLLTYLEHGRERRHDEVLFLSAAADILGLVIQLKRREELLREANRKLETWASFDELTQLYNRRLFLQRLSEEASKSRRTGEPLGLIIADIDHFKRVNDTYGHVVGDQVIHDIAAALRRGCRDYDFAGRYGGEEFVVCMVGGKQADFRAVADRIRQAVQSRTFSYEAVDEMQVTISLGLAVWDGEETVTKLLSRADHALYRAKTSGRNRVCDAPLDVPSEQHA